MLVSGCMITKNEVEYLEYSIRSFINYVDELIIVDDQSTDGTLDIASSFGPKVQIVRGEYNGDKARQRNEYILRAQGKWIFCPDGDEVYFPDQMQYLFDRWRDENDLLFIGVRLLNFWKDYVHVVHGPVWDAIMQRTYRNIPGLGHYDVHHSVSLPGGKGPLAKVAQKTGRAIYPQIYVPHYSYCKNARSILNKIEYYMTRDNENCRNADNLDSPLEWSFRHPFISEEWSSPRYGPNGLFCCGSVWLRKDHVERYDGPHPDLIKKHPDWKLMTQYVKQMNRYMEDHWQFHNHLDHERHQNRIKLAASICVGDTVLEVGCANGYSTHLMQLESSARGQKQCFMGVEPTDWGFQQAKATYPEITFYKFLGENLPFEDGRFDTVLQAEIIEHCQDPRKLSDEGWRLAKKRYVVTTPTHPHPDPDHKRHFTIEQMREFLKPYGQMQAIGLRRDGSRANSNSEIYFMIAWVDKE